MTDPLFRGPAIRIRQPLGEFWAVCIPANVLLRVTRPDPLRLLVDPSQDKNGTEWELSGHLLGNQRPLEEKRLTEIAKFIDGMESTFPNSIILAVTSQDDDEEASEDKQWQLEADGGSTNILIPQNPVQASVVDGQHRLYAFGRTKEPERSDFDLLCSVFFDIPRSIQAVIFATINTTQKQVRRGLAMNLYGYNIEDEDRLDWSPDKLAVFMVRRLNFDEKSPLFKRVRIEARNAPDTKLLPGAKRAVPMAAVVDGILGLISKKPKDDRTTLSQRGLFARSKKRTHLPDDGAVLRDLFTSCQDGLFYEILCSYFSEVSSQLWAKSIDGSMLTRAVGIRGILDFMADLLRKIRTDKAAGPGELATSLRRSAAAAFAKVGKIDFGDSFFEASFRGRRRVENIFRLANKLAEVDQMPEADRSEYVRLLK